MNKFSEYNFKNEKALVRVDFNVPLDENFNITDDTRIKASLPSIKKILDDGGSVILMSHLGRPKDGPSDKYSLKHLIVPLRRLLAGATVLFANDCIGQEAEDMAKSLHKGEILLLENLRFHKEEEKGDRAFAEKLAKLGDVYVNDAFGTTHRAHASTAVIAEFFSPEKELLAKAEAKGVCIHLPSDSLIADKFSNDAETSTAPSNNIPDGWMGLDIGANACEQFCNVIMHSKTILWNGPMGVFEMEKFQHGTKCVASAVAQSTQQGAFSLVGGGDSVAAINQFGYADKVSYVSTGGGAMLEYFEGKTLPGIAAIKQN